MDDTLIFLIFFIAKAKDIVACDVIKFRKFDNMTGFDFVDTGFISAVLFSFQTQCFGYLFLSQIIVFPQFFQPFGIIHKNHPKIMINNFLNNS